MVWQVNGTPLTLTGTADDMDITDLTARVFNQFLIHKIPSSFCDINITYNLFIDWHSERLEMEEQLRLALTEFLNVAVIAKDFVVAEAPLVIQELLRWKLAWASVLTTPGT